MLMLKILPKIFFAILYMAKVGFFGYVVYFTIKYPLAEKEVYILLAIFFGALILVQAIGEFMYKKTLELLQEEDDLEEYELTI